MNKYFLLLIASFASLSLNAAAGQGYQYKPQELVFVERGEVKGGTQFGARILAKQEWYKFETTDGRSYFVQHKEGGRDLATGKDTGVDGTSVMISEPDGKQLTIQTVNPFLTSFSFYEAYKYLDFCRKNQGKFPVSPKTK